MVMFENKQQEQGQEQGQEQQLCLSFLESTNKRSFAKDHEMACSDLWMLVRKHRDVVVPLLTELSELHPETAAVLALRPYLHIRKDPTIYDPVKRSFRTAVEARNALLVHQKFEAWRCGGNIVDQLARQEEVVMSRDVAGVQWIALTEKGRAVAHNLETRRHGHGNMSR